MINPDDIINSYMAGESLNSLAIKHGTHRQAIKKILLENDISINSKPQKKEIDVDINVLVSAYESGKSLLQISKEYDVPLAKMNKH